MLAAFRYHPGKFMAAQTGYSFVNLEIPWIASGLNDYAGAVISLAAGFKNVAKNYEVKAYGGTKHDLAFSYKNDHFKYEEKELKGNVSVHYRMTNISDTSTWHAAAIGEVELSKPLKIPGSSFKIGNTPIQDGLTPSLHTNLKILDTRASFNYKFELPKAYQPFGWTPSVGVEIRK